MVPPVLHHSWQRLARSFPHRAFVTSSRQLRDWNNKGGLKDQYTGYWDLILEQPTQTRGVQDDPPLHQKHAIIQPDEVTSSLTFLPGTLSSELEELDEDMAPEILSGLAHTTTDAAINAELLEITNLESKLSKPEVPTACCMSGCVHCVWDLYQEDMEDYIDKRREIRDKRSKLLERLGNTSAFDLMVVPEEVEVADEMDPGMRAFLEMEKTMSRKKQP
ncbi:oxidoreductase-like protein [Phlyctochytrium arcticum]|nr:oxidoreductase-like protein [Phlyctochytrium arcticum]